MFPSLCQFLDVSGSTLFSSPLVWIWTHLTATSLLAPFPIIPQTANFVRCKLLVCFSLHTHMKVKSAMWSGSAQNDSQSNPPTTFLSHIKTLTEPRDSLHHTLEGLVTGAPSSTTPPAWSCQSSQPRCSILGSAQSGPQAKPRQPPTFVNKVAGHSHVHSSVHCLLLLCCKSRTQYWRQSLNVPQRWKYSLLIPLQKKR